jgi:integrase
VPDEHVEAVLTVLASPMQAMVRLQRLTGMRPGEVMQMRWCDIDRSAAIWIYRPARHKRDETHASPVAGQCTHDSGADERLRFWIAPVEF